MSLQYLYLWWQVLPGSCRYREQVEMVGDGSIEGGWGQTPLEGLGYMKCSEKKAGGSLNTAENNQSHSSFEQVTPSSLCLWDRPGGPVENRWRGAGLQWEAYCNHLSERSKSPPGIAGGVGEVGLEHEPKRCPQGPLVLPTYTEDGGRRGNSVGAIQGALEKSRSSGFPWQLSPAGSQYTEVLSSAKGR